MKLKKLLAMTLTFSMIVALAGCGNSNSEKNKSSKEENKASVEFWNDKYGQKDQTDIDKMIESIEGLTSVDMNVVAYPDTASYQTAMQQSIKEEDAPGLFTWWSGPQLETIAKSGYLEDLTHLWDEYVEVNGVSSDIAESLTVDGKIVAVPYSIIYNAIIYNSHVFEDNNLQVPKNFDEFLDACAVLKGKGITPIVLKNDSWAGFIWFQQLLAAKDPQLYLDVCNGTKKYTDTDVVEVMEIWKDMLDKGYFSAPMAIQDMKKEIAAGKAAMMLEPNYEAVNIEKDYDVKCGEDISTFALPTISGGKKTIFYEITPLCVSANSKDKEVAKEVLKKWFTKDHQTILTETDGNVNTSQVEVDNPVVNQMIANSQDTENYAMILRYYENTPAEVRDVALDEFMKFQMGNAEVDEVLNTIQKKADEVFSK